MGEGGKMKKRRIKKSIQLTFLIIILLMCGFVWGMNLQHYITKDLIIKNKPTIEINKGILYEKNVKNIGFPVIGNYNIKSNHIRVSLSSKDIKNTLIHEYGHYIYEILSKEDLNYWNNEICNTSKKIEGYEDYDLCNEWFARKFATYTLGNYDIPEREFMKKVHAYYLR